jgi:integrase
MGKLNDKAVRAAKIESGEKFLADGDGLYLRVRPGEAQKMWFYRYTMGGTARKVQLGAFPQMGLAEARTIAGEMTGKRRQGIDPILEREAGEAAAKREAEAVAREVAKAASRITVTALFDRWVAVDLTRHRDGGAYVKDQMNRHVLPVIGTLIAEDVRKGHITEVTDKLLATGKERTAKVAFSQMRQMFRFAVDRDILEIDPTANIRKAKIGGKDTERDRVLSEVEIRELSGKIAGARLLPSTEAAVWLALSTACRIGELLTARWDDLDLDSGVWKMPLTKNGKPHTVYLSQFSVTQFEEIKAAAEADQKAKEKAGLTVKPLNWIFPDRTDSKPVCVKTVSKQLADRQKEPTPGELKGKPMSRRSNKVDALRLPGGQWRPHDLRRTAATMMVALGVLPEVAERCLNHTEENKMKRIYQRHSYEAEMRQAWSLLGDRLELLTSGADNVVTLRSRA